MAAAEHEARAHVTPAFVGMNVAGLAEIFAFRNIQNLKKYFMEWWVQIIL